MWILALIGLGVLTAVIQLALAGFPHDPVVVMSTLLLHQIVVTHGLIAVSGS